MSQFWKFSLSKESIGPNGLPRPQHVNSCVTLWNFKNLPICFPNTHHTWLPTKSSMSLVPWPLWCPYLSLSWPRVVNQSTHILNRWSGSWFPVMFPATCELQIGTRWYHVDEGIPNNKLTWYYTSYVYKYIYQKVKYIYANSPVVSRFSSCSGWVASSSQ